MYIPGNFSLFNAQRGLIAAQTGLNVIGHNISNANTPGYSRQQIVQVTENPYSIPGLAGPLNGLQLGQGPIVQGIGRIRDVYLDRSFRAENSTLGFNAQQKSTLGRIESFIGEPSDNGINTSLQAFFSAAQQLSQNPENAAARTSFMQRAGDLVNTFKDNATQLDNLQLELVGRGSVAGSIASSRLGVGISEVNSQLASVADLNRQILSVVSAGGQANDLMDQRDQILDQLSKKIDITVDNTTNNQVNVTIAGHLMVSGVQQLDSLQAVANPAAAPASEYTPTLIQTVTAPATDITNSIKGGELKAYVDVAGNASPGQTTVRGLLVNLDTLLGAVVSQVNALQAGGRDLTGATPAAPNDQIIVPPAVTPPLAIFGYTANSNIVANPNLLAAASGAGAFAGPGDGRNALALAQLKTTGLVAGVKFDQYLNSTLSALGVDASQYNSRYAAQNNAVNNVDQQRQSVSGVNADQEAVDLVRYQRAFEASSKMVKTFDQMMESILSIVQ